MYEDLTFIREDGYHIRGRLYRPAGEGPFPAVIFSHGFGGNFRYLEHYGPRFAREGIAMFLFDFCGGGPESASDGTMLEMSVLTECGDLELVFDRIRALPCVDPGSLFLMGESQGGYVSALAASRLKEAVRGLILWYPALVIEDDSRGRLAEGKPAPANVFGLAIGAKYTRDALSLSIYDEIPKYRGRVLILHGDCDPVVPLSYSERACRVYADASLHVIRGAGHGYNAQESQEAGRLSADFVKSLIRR